MVALNNYQMNVYDHYTEQLNALVKRPGCIERQLTDAIAFYSERIQELRSSALLSADTDVVRAYRSYVAFVDQLSTYFGSAERIDTEITKLQPIVKDMWEHADEQVQAYEKVLDDQRTSQVLDFVSYYDSSIAAARLLADNDLIVGAIREYLYYVHSHMDPHSRETILTAAEQHSHCLETLSRTISEFEQHLKDIGFPISLSSAFEDVNTKTWDDDQLRSVCTWYKLLCPVNISHLNVLLQHPLIETISLPMQVILRPLEKRFYYHFTGDRRTNRIDKPEWYMTQVLQWIRDNDYVLTILDRDFFTDDNEASKLRTEFIRGLVTLIMDKLYTDLGLKSHMVPRYLLDLKPITNDTRQSPSSEISPALSTLPSGELMDNVELFSHLVDTVLQTDARLMQLAYTTEHPRPSDLLSLPAIFQRWITLELRLAVRQLDTVLSSPTAWNMCDEESLRPQCADEFHALIYAVGLRGRQLENKLCRSRFLRLQLHLIRIFFDRIHDYAAGSLDLQVFSESGVTVRKAELSTQGLSRRLLDAFHMISGTATVTSAKSNEDLVQRYRSSRWIDVLNALAHLHETLGELANDPYYVSFYEDPAMRRLLEAPDPWMLDIGLCAEEAGGLSFEIEPDEDVTSTANRFCQIPAFHSGVFTQVLQLYRNGLNNMLRELTDAIVNELRSASRPYVGATDYWLRASQSSVTAASTYSLQISGPASALFIRLRDWLHLLHRSLHGNLFTYAWQQIARAMDDLLYKQLILSNRFTPSGAAQLRYDLTHCLYPLFAPYTDRAESHFPQSRDSSILLNLFRGSAELLRTALREPLQSTGQKWNPLAPLLELGVSLLTPEEAEHVLSLRACPD